MRPTSSPDSRAVTAELAARPETPEPGSPPRGEGLPRFADGDVVADRYRIVRFIAQGGMGEVYEAEDLTLRGRVALKTIRPDTAAKPGIVDRFKREIQIARRITHPNVCRIYDVGVHRSDPETLFLTMEFLSGETLQTRIARQGAMSGRDALPLVEQMAAGLEAAHEAGVIHRDFKSSNVILVPISSGVGIRAVVTDFGLARPVESEDDMATLTGTGAMLGTPAFMAPEQVKGLKLTLAADVYAFGVVLYETVTGKRPFEAATPALAAAKRLFEPPPPPRQHVPDLDPLWEAVILRCLERDPAARFPRALDVVRALRIAETPTAEAVTVQNEALAPKRTLPYRWILAACLVIAIALAFAGIRARRATLQQSVGGVAGPKAAAPVPLLGAEAPATASSPANDVLAPSWRPKSQTRQQKLPPDFLGGPVVVLEGKLAMTCGGKTVGIVMVVADDGSLANSKVISPSGIAACDEVALSAVRRARFKAAIAADGKPVEGRFSVSVRL